MLRKSISKLLILILSGLVLAPLGIVEAQGGYDSIVQEQTSLYNDAHMIYQGDLTPRNDSIARALGMSVMYRDSIAGIQTLSLTCPYQTNAVFEARVIELINVERAKIGVAPLHTRSQLITAAQLHSADMACNNYFSHTGLDGSTVAVRISNQGYNGYYMGENIAGGYSTPEDVMNGWMNSPGHKANILNANYIDVGVGYSYWTGSTYRAYWTTDFASPFFYTISGNAGVSGVTMTYTDGTSQFVTADGAGNYSITVPSGWSGTVIPYKIGYSFTPASKPYSNVQSNQTGQDYTAQVCATCADTDTTGVFRPTNGLLYLKNLNITGYADVAINYGLGGDYPVTGDWDGNGTATIGIYRNGSFYLRNSNTLGYADLMFAFGQPGDQPVAGDWNGDGIDTIGIYRPSTGQFLLRDNNSAGAADYSFYLGNIGDVGIAGDWTAKGFDTVGVFRPSNGIIFLKNTNQTGFADIALNYGLAGDQPVTGDWNGDGIDTIGVYRNAQFLLRNSNTIGFADIVFGLGNPGDMPIAGNWDGLP